VGPLRSRAAGLLSGRHRQSNQRGNQHAPHPLGRGAAHTYARKRVSASASSSFCYQAPLVAHTHTLTYIRTHTNGTNAHSPSSSQPFVHTVAHRTASCSSQYPTARWGSLQLRLPAPFSARFPLCRPNHRMQPGQDAHVHPSPQISHTTPIDTEQVRAVRPPHLFLPGRAPPCALLASPPATPPFSLPLPSPPGCCLLALPFDAGVVWLPFCAGVFVPAGGGCTRMCVVRVAHVLLRARLWLLFCADVNAPVGGRICVCVHVCCACAPLCPVRTRAHTCWQASRRPPDELQ